MSGASGSVAFRDALAVWARIGLLSFGGPAGQIALMHRVIVAEKRWLDEPRFLHALNYCMLLPGPEAQQLATYIGWLLNGVRGGVVAGVLFILPGALAILALSVLYVQLGDLTAVEGLFFGLKAAVVAIVLQALMRIASRALQGVQHWLLASAAFVALWAFNVPFPLVVLGAVVVGYVGARWFAGGADKGNAAPAGPVDTVHRPGTARAAIVCAALWVATLLALVVLLGTDDVYTRLAGFFSLMAMVTFGGAYAVLAWVAQQAVEHYQWMQPGEMLDGLALAETTPGPLILVTQFVGFLAALRESGGALWAGVLGALVTTWVTFLPCFLWIFAGAPFVERLRGHRPLSAALAAITAAVVGVIASLALWFVINFLFDDRVRIQVAGFDVLLPVPASLSLPALALSLFALAIVFVLRAGVLAVLAGCGLLGVLWTVFF